MAEERMLNDEILLGLIKANSGGGGGGTSNYNLLDNLPQINGNTLTGNKSASDLDLVGAVDGKGLSTNDYTNADKAIVDGVTAALEGKQDALTAGNYISIANDGTINVTQGIGVYDVYSYEIKSINSGYATKITKRKNGVFESEQDISNGAYSSENRLNVDNRFEFWYTFAGYLWHYKLLVDSNEHQKDEEVSWEYSTLVDYTETFNVSQDSSTDLATKGDVNTAIAGKQDILTFDDTPTDNSNNPVKSNGIYDALALKQDATDNSLDTDAKTIVGAINEHEGDIDSLKSGLTTLDNEVNGDATTYPYADVITIPDAVPSNLADCNVKIEPVQDLHGQSAPYVGGAGKNKLPMTVDGIKAANTDGTWSGNTYTYNDIVYKLVTDNDGNLVKITVNGTTTLRSFLIVGSMSGLIGQEVIMNGGASGGVASYTASGYCMFTGGIGVPQEYDIGSGATFTVSSYGGDVQINVNNTSVTNLDFYPMIRLATETDATFAPYTNYCPITGHTEASVQRSRPNMLDGLEQGLYASNGIKVNDNKQVRSSDYIDVVGSESYVISTDTTGLKVYVSQYSEKNTTRIIGSDWQSLPYTVTTESNAKYIHIMFKKNNNNDLSPSEVVNPRCDTLSAYGEIKTYTLAIGDTIYGGTVDFDSGVMTVDRRFVVYDGPQTVQNVQRIDNVVRGQFVIQNSAAYPHAISNYLEWVNDWSLDQPHFYIYDNKLNVFLPIPNDGTSTWDSYLTSNPLQVCYPLATPTTVQLTPQQIQLLKGQNTLTASTGQISVTVNGVSGSIGQVQEQVNELAEDVADVQSGLANIVITQNSSTAIAVNDSYEFNADITAKAITICVYRYGLADSITVLATQVEYWNNNNELYFVTGAGTDHVILKMQYNGTTKKCTATVKESTIAGIADTAVVISVVTMY